MYQRKARQASFLEDAALFGGVRLNPEDRWIRMSKLIPREIFEEQHASLFVNHKETGKYLERVL